MKVTPFNLMLFFISLNLSLWVIQVTEVIPVARIPEIESPTAIQDLLIGSILSGAIVAAVVLVLTTGNIVYGASSAMIVFVLNMLTGTNNVIHWAFFGLGNYVNIVTRVMGLDPIIATVCVGVIGALTSPVWFWFIIDLFSGRKGD